MNAWILGQVRDAITSARSLRAQGAERVFLHYRRGAVRASREPRLAGYEPVTLLPVPLEKSDTALTDWALHEVQRTPCCP